jgi:acyl-CoA oxidase
MMTDPIMSLDTAMFTILAAHVGLTIGTLSRHLHKRPDLRPLVNRLLRFDTVGIYLLTERGHGLDAFNIETTATKTPDGFIINTPREEACKYVPFLEHEQPRNELHIGLCLLPHHPLVFQRSLWLWLGS